MVTAKPSPHDILSNITTTTTIIIIVAVIVVIVITTHLQRLTYKFTDGRPLLPVPKLVLVLRTYNSPQLERSAVCAWKHEAGFQTR